MVAEFTVIDLEVEGPLVVVCATRPEDVTEYEDWGRYSYQVCW
jgi:hypothetical protein